MEDPFLDDPSLYEQDGSQEKPFSFGHPPPRPSRYQVARLRVPDDLPTRLLERMLPGKAPNPKTYVNYPTRIFHLKPQNNLQIGADWEETFLWQKVSSSHVRAEWVEELPTPGLLIPRNGFPETLYSQALGMLSHGSDSLQFAFALDVINAEYDPSTAAGPRRYLPFPDIRGMATIIIERLSMAQLPEACEVAAEIDRLRGICKELDSFIRFRDCDGKPTGMGFRCSRDILFLDSEFLMDFLRRESRNSLRDPTRPDLRLVPFLSSTDRAKITSLVVSSAPFRDQALRKYLCTAIARSFPNLVSLRVASVGIFDPLPAERWQSTTKFAELVSLEAVAALEARRARGDSYVDHPLEDDMALVDMENASAQLEQVTGIFLDGKGRFLGGGRARTSILAHGIEMGLLLDPELRYDVTHPPLIREIGRAAADALWDTVWRKKERLRANRLAALGRLRGWWTRIPRPSPGLAAPAARPRPRWYRRDIKLPGFYGFFERLANEDPDSEPGSASSVALSEVQTHAQGREPGSVEPYIILYHRDAFDRIVQRGWTGFVPGIDLSQLDRR